MAALTEELLQCLPGGETPEEALDLQTLGERISAFLQAQPAEKRNLFLRRCGCFRKSLCVFRLCRTVSIFHNHYYSYIH